MTLYGVRVVGMVELRVGIVRVRNIEIGQDRPLFGFHAISVANNLVIVPQKMQESMHYHMAQMLIQRLVLRHSFARDRLVSDGDIAQITCLAVPGVQVSMPRNRRLRSVSVRSSASRIEASASPST